jgi:hypothetical protein
LEQHLGKKKKKETRSSEREAARVQRAGAAGG